MDDDENDDVDPMDGMLKLQYGMTSICMLIAYTEDEQNDNYSECSIYYTKCQSVCMSSIMIPCT